MARRREDPKEEALRAARALNPRPEEVTDPASSALLGETCGRAARVELFEGHARSGDVRAAKYAGAALSWSDHRFGSDG